MAADPTERPLLVQLHWQDLADHTRTEFVGQGQFTDQASFERWCGDLLNRRGHEMPQGWCPMVCTEDCEHFVRTVTR